MIYQLLRHHKVHKLLISAFDIYILCLITRQFQDGSTSRLNYSIKQTIKGIFFSSQMLLLCDPFQEPKQFLDCMLLNTFLTHLQKKNWRSITTHIP